MVAEEDVVFHGRQVRRLRIRDVGTKVDKAGSLNGPPRWLGARHLGRSRACSLSDTEVEGYKHSRSLVGSTVFS